MTTERKPVAFGDMRNWMKALKSAGELREIDAEVDWNVELGTITRLAQGAGTGPALADEVVRLILILKINALARGFSGIRRSVIEALLKLLNA